MLILFYITQDGRNAIALKYRSYISSIQSQPTVNTNDRFQNKINLIRKYDCWNICDILNRVGIPAVSCHIVNNIPLFESRLIRHALRSESVYDSYVTTTRAAVRLLFCYI